ncbi:MAG: PKD domain-containing protein, partial [Saprospiraceae bacterium]
DTFNVTLTVTDDIGCTASFTVDDAVITTRPATFFELDTVACTEQTVSFVNMSEGAGLTYSWTFGDGNVSTDTSPTHFYLTEGEFEVCLTAIDVNGCDSTYCDSVLVVDPVANFVADTTFAFCPPLVVTFTNLSENGVSGEYEWDFGDDTGLSNADNPAHVYTGAGIFDVSLIATSPSGCTDTIVFEEYIELQGPIGEFSFNPDTGCVDHTVTFITTSLNPVSHIMDYGNGDIDSSNAIISLDTFIYTYTQAGDYFPAMILVDELGCAQVFDSDSAIIVESLEIDFIATDTLLCDGGTTSFFSQISSSEPITLIEWTFEGITPSTSNDPNPSDLTYDTFGQYDVTLTVSNGVCTRTITKPDFIDVDPVPVASFIANPDEGCEALDVDF